MSAVETRLGIALETVCCDESRSSAGPLFMQMRRGNYDLMSVLPCPLTIDQWRDEHRTARKRANRAFGRGYRPDDLAGTGGEDWTSINRSATHRQGRPMSSGYQADVPYSPLPQYPCPRHAVRATGVLRDDVLVAYLVMLRAGELALVSQILGHADYLKDEVMSLLFQHALEREIAADPECLVVYNRHDSGSQGLREWKEWHGFQEMPVEWLP